MCSKLERLGIEAKVQHVPFDTDEQHRLLVGPVRDLAKLNSTRHRLRAADVDVMTQRVGDSRGFRVQRGAGRLLASSRNTGSSSLAATSSRVFLARASPLC